MHGRELNSKEIGRSFGSIFLLSLMKVSGVMLIAAEGNPQSPAINVDEHLKYFDNSEG